MKGHPDDFDPIMQAMFGGGFDEIMDGYTDEELNAMGKEMGPAELFAHLMEKAFLKNAIDEVKEKLRRSVDRILSDEVEDYILDTRAESIVKNNGISYQGKRDDRLGENMDIALANFEFTGNIELPFSKNEKVERFHYELGKKENEKVGEFLMHTESEFFKLLVYYVKVKNFKDMRKLIEVYEEKKNEMRFHFTHKDDGVIDYHAHFNACLRELSEFIGSIGSRKLEWLLKRFQVSSVEDFSKLFIDTPYMYPVLLKTGTKILEYFLDNYNITDTDGLIKMFEDSNNRKLSDLDFRYESWDSFKYLLEYFNVKEIKDIGKIMSSDNVFNIINKASLHNFKILLDSSDCKDIEVFDNICSEEFIKKNIENTDYEGLVNMIDGLGLVGKEKKSMLLKIISTSYDRDFSFICDNLGEIISQFENLLNIKDFIIDILFNSKNRIEILKVLSELLEKHGDELKNCDFSRLSKLKDFMGGYITSYLAKELLLTDDENSLVSNWDETIKGFKKGKFDHNNKLHQNLEYKRFRKVINHEKIQKYMRSHYSINDYFRLFSTNGNIDRDNLSQKEKFEIECAAHESKLLNEYITEVKEVADRMGKKVLVIPNLSYGYLPVSPIYDSLSKEGVDFLIGAKIGSTECHENTTVINSRLLKSYRKSIINEQPIILVVDGTKHILDRNGGDGKTARYPDAYQGYLNQVIAINDSMEKDKKEEDRIDMNYVGKSEENMEWLRENEDFQRTVNIYNDLGDKKPKRLYNFAFWNTSGMEMIIRNQREKAEKIAPINPKLIRGPTMIFCNIGVLDEQIPEEIKSKYKGQKHTPAYFDDSGRIVNFEFSYNEYGINYINNLEDELKRTYGEQSDKEHDIDKIATLIRYNSKHSTGVSNEGGE